VERRIAEDSSSFASRAPELVTYALKELELAGKDAGDDR